MTTAEFTAVLLKRNPSLDGDLLRRAHDYSSRVHHGQERQSGDPFIVHCEEVAYILGQLGLDSSTVAAGILHDVLEDSALELSELTREFGEEIASLVDGVTKMAGLRFGSRERAQAENFRKMLLSVVNDVRVIPIKLADRLHNMRTIGYLSKERIERISRETREIYAPLAGRFGMGRIQRELDDLAFRWLEPEEHVELSSRVLATRAQREAYIEEVVRPIRERLVSDEVQAFISGRAKNLWSIYRKMTTRGKRLEEIYDLVAIRIIGRTVGECYRILGIVHTLYTPVHDRFKDYIATPKLNAYRSLHTTVVGPRGEMLEIQIRTEEMHEQAEVGIAAHWAYKEGKPSGEELRQYLVWVRQLLEGNVDLTEGGEFLEALKVDLYQDEVFVFTPRGDLKQLPKGATPVDFAYAVHTDVGHHCAGARIGGKLVSLKRELESGDTVEITTSESAHPSRDWLGTVATSRARSKIRQYLRAKADDESVALGRKIIEREIKRSGAKVKGVSLDDIAQSLGMEGSRELAAAVGRGGLSVSELARKLRPEGAEPVPGIVRSLTRRARTREAGVRIDGIGDIMVSFAKCCQPLPGDQIIGIITRERGISVHTVACPNTFGPTIEEERKIAVEWDVGRTQTFPASFVVTGEPRRSFLADLSKAIESQGVDVTSASMSTENGETVAHFQVVVSNLHRFRKLLRTIERLKGVSSVERRRSPQPTC